MRSIKRALKARQAHYADLAKHMKMSESGVKKMLNAKDISLQRVVEICDFLGVLPGQLLSLAETSEIQTVQFTARQEEALLRDRKLLAVYWIITIEKRNHEELKAIQRLSEDELKRILKHLCTLGLFSKLNGKYVPVHSGKFRWPEHSKLAQTLNREWSELVLKRSLDQNLGANLFHRLVTTQLSEDSYENLKTELEDVLRRAVQESEREELGIPRARLRNISALVACVPKGIFDL